MDFVSVPVFHSVVGFDFGDVCDVVVMGYFDFGGDYVSIFVCSDVVLLVD